MAELSPKLFNPCSLNENEQIPAKIWELLRRNEAFKRTVLSLMKYDQRAKAVDAKIRVYLNRGIRQGQDTPESRELLALCSFRNKTSAPAMRLVENIGEKHPFAGVALQWLVPEPLFHCHVATWPRGKKWKERGVFVTRFLRVGEGVTPNIKDKGWVWRNPEKPDVGGHPMRRGPEVYWTKSRFKRLRSWVNPILEWKQYSWPFTVEHSWADAPAQFRREFNFIWRRQFDCRPMNPLTKDRRDSPTPHEITFFRDWELMTFRASGQITRNEVYQQIRFSELANHYRVFAIPQTILTKASADAMGKWLAEEFKKGSDLFGDLLKDNLLNDAELLGTTNEWTGWLSHQARELVGVAKDTHFYRRCRYMNQLVDLIYPNFQITRHLTPPKHRARGKPYVRK